ncbi:DNA-binding transcriptional dual regulator TorR [Rhodovastum atsumiense]|uniref:Regulatory protein VirG n=1 Tax=Rhodovastum atsumiense TaxID=504468 RepID=A0A5M6IYK4_9PROT|nr:response regulator transcription factor [Rhodovastum atsumiense]KAA5613424.1 response regulator transcription factor [Rhodovastum atsumiense]CAH2603152.1 DNA-binding transcriptional dual regulator TorR [Rhodovastum atsumiense]
MKSPDPAAPSRINVCIVDDEPVVLAAMADYFENAGFVVHRAGTAEALRRILRRERIDLVLLDIRLPDGDGLALMRDLRAQSNVPVILVTSRAEEADRVVGLELGADDYVTKPFSPRELLARAHSVLRRTHGSGEAASPHRDEIRRFAGWQLNLAGHQLIAPDGRQVRLTHAEFDLLAALVNNAGRIMSRNALLDAMSGRDLDPNDRTVDVLIGRLRRKLDPGPGQPGFITTEYGLGYLFAAQVT